MSIMRVCVCIYIILLSVLSVVILNLYAYVYNSYMYVFRAYSYVSVVVILNLLFYVCAYIYSIFLCL